MKYISTRGEQIDNASKVILNGMQMTAGFMFRRLFHHNAPLEEHRL